MSTPSHTDEEKLDHLVDSVKGKLILVVDDSTLLLQVAKVALEAAGRASRVAATRVAAGAAGDGSRACECGRNEATTGVFVPLLCIKSD